MDKVQKIRKEVERKLDVMQYQVHRKDAYKELKSILDYIDSFQEEPVSIWHDASEKPERDDLLIETNDGRIIHRQSINNYGIVKRWAYTSALLNLDNSCNLGNNSQEEPVNEDFEKTFISMVNATHENNGSYSLHDFAQRLYNIAKEELEEPVSEDLEKAAKEHSFIDGSEDIDEYARYNLEKYESFKAGSKWQKEQFEKKILEHIYSMQEEPVSEDLEKAMQHNAPDNIGIDDLLYWRNGFITGANWQKTKDESTTDDLGKYIDALSKQFPEVSFAKLSRIAVRVAKWQKEQEYTCYEEAFEDGAKWKAEQFEQERLKHCDELTEAQAEIESDFVTQHLKENNRTPTFIDAIEYGMQTMKEQMMKGAIDAKIGSFTNGTIYDADFNIDSNLKDGDKVKVIVIKEECR